MSTFYICKQCGNADVPHNFRHKFTRGARVKYDDKRITLNAEDFSLENGKKCGVQGCTVSEKLHVEPIIYHKFQPDKFRVRNIKLVVPSEMCCVVCNDDILSHNSLGVLAENGVNSHHFTLELLVENPSGENVQENITLLHPEDDEEKIIFIKK